MSKSSVQQILNILPDDRPITAIQIIENLGNCPSGFQAISRVYDHDQEADLRETSIFRSGSARYLCFSKSEGIPNLVLNELTILRDNYNPPKGCSILNRAVDSNQKAWRKKQLCYRLSNRRLIREAITDIIVCSHIKKAPLGFKLAGEINGVAVCYKMGNVQDTDSGRGPPTRVDPSAGYPSLTDEAIDHDYEILRRPAYPVVPSRPAPPRPLPSSANTNQNNSGSVYHSLDGVPFVVNPKFVASSSDKVLLPAIKTKTMQQILREYDYPFTVERQT